MASKNKLYCDFNIPIGPKNKETIEEAVKLGYKVLALNRTIVARECLSSGQQNTAKKAKKRKISSGPESKGTPIPPPESPKWIEQIQEANQGVRILHRLTISFGDLSELQLILQVQSGIIGQYEMLALLPINHEALQACLNNNALVFDILTFEFEGPRWIGKVVVNRSRGTAAAGRDIYFELSYCAALRGDISLENLIYTSGRLLEEAFTNSFKNVILSSGAANPLELRATKDVTNMGYLLGLSSTDARISLRDHPGRIITKIDARKFGKTFIAFIPDRTKKVEETS